jgi:hypothetical protein
MNTQRTQAAAAVRALAAAVFLLLAAGCASLPESPEARRLRATQLAAQLAQIVPQATAAETREFASAAVEHSADLRRAYGVRLNHNLHNVLVYWGLKERGFCWHWQQDLAARLGGAAHPQLELHRIVADAGSTWHEHHALAVTPPGGSWDEGIVLDAWRREGVLWFGPVKTDGYPWREEKP